MKAIIRAAFFLPVLAQAQVPTGYYNGTQNLSGTALQSVLHGIIDNHTPLNYGGSTLPNTWTAFTTTDVKPNGKIWDIYSDVPGGSPQYQYTPVSNQCGVGGNGNNSENSCYNHEHTWPRSKFNGDMPMESDLWIVYPADYYVNAQRSDFPYGKVNSPTKTFTNGGRLGPQSFSGAPSTTAYEPIDSFKGDLARTYFYIATRYLGEDSGWEDWEMANKAVLKPWAVQMLMQWHQLDPVSAKERARNNAVYAQQGNRNPFIDSPGFVPCIWGTGGCGTAGMEDVRVAGFSVSPNPAGGVVQVVLRAKGGVLELVDLQGRVWLRREVDEEAEMVDVEKLPRGVWVMRWRGMEGVWVQRVVLQ